MSALLPFWLLIAPPLVLLFDSMRSKGASSAMGTRASAAPTHAGAAPVRTVR